MKKVLGLILSLASIGFVASTAEAKAAESTVVATTTANAAASQWGRDRNGRRVYNRRRPIRVVTRSRIVRNGRRVYRETYQVRYLPSGFTQTRLISRVRIA